MRRYLYNMPIGMKISCLPLLLLAAMVGLGIYALVLMGKTSNQFESLEDGLSTQTTAIVAFESATRGSNARLYRLVSLATNEAASETIATTARTLSGELDTLAAQLTEITASLRTSGYAADPVTALEASFGAYLKSARNVIDMAETDAGTALVFMNGAERNADALSTRIADAVEWMTAQRNDAINGMHARADRERVTFVAALLALAALTVVFSFLAARSISRPLVGLATTVAAIAEKHYAVTIPALDCANEIGRIATSVGVLRERSVEADRLSQELREDHERSATRARAFEAMTNAFQANISHVVAAVGGASAHLRSRSEAMSATADQANLQCAAVSSAAGQASANVHAVAAASEELSSSIAEIGRQVAQAASLSNEAARVAKQTNTSVEHLTDATSRIGQVVELISGIAGQTNLLALNATIEAARAGEAGKGFAVVASEVKTLANQTAHATGDIASQIEAVRAAAQEAVVAIQSIVATIGQLSEISNSIATATEQQAAATAEIARNVMEAARGTEDVSATITDVSSGTLQTGSIAADVLSASADLGQQSDRLRSEVEAFIAQARAA